MWPVDGARDDDPLLLVVCDGMGGTNAGEVASRIATDAVVRVFRDAPGDDPLETLTRAIDTANREVWEHGRDRPHLEGMGTTCTAAALRGDELSIAHVGDSRAYLVRDGRARALTSDHSIVAQLVASHQLTEEQARSDRRRNVVTRSVGAGPSVEIDAARFEEPLRPGDTVLLCTDGLHGPVREDDLGRLASQDSLSRACRDLVALANERGGPDNVTVVLARIEAPAGHPRTSARRPPPRHARPPAPGAAGQRTLRLLIAALAGLVLVLSGIAWLVVALLRGDRADAPASLRVASAPRAERSA